MKPNRFVVATLVAVGLFTIVLSGCAGLPGKTMRIYDATQLLRQGKVQEFNAAKQNGRTPSSFVFADLDGVELQGVNLSYTTWPLGKCRGANLANADFRGADISLELHGAVLRGANFEGAELMGSNCSGVDLTRANLRGTQLQAVTFTEAILEDADLRGARARGANFDHVSFRNADLRGANFANASFRNADFTGAKIEGANFDGADITDATGLPSPPPARANDDAPSPGLKMY